MRTPDEVLVGFAHALRAAGLPVTHDRTTAFLAAVALVGMDDAGATFRAGRATLCAGPDDVTRYARVFEAWFGAHDELPRGMPSPQRATQLHSPLPFGDENPAGGTGQPDVVEAVASQAEVLGHRDVAALTPSEKQLVDAMIASLRPRSPVRRAARRTAWRRGEVDVHRTLRDSMRHAGEPALVAHRRRRPKPRRVVLLIDVSASMRLYADSLLRLAHRIGRGCGDVEVFTLGTRLTRITRALRTRDAEAELVRAGSEVPDWAGGTRLGETLQAFLDRWGARGVARGAVVVVLSDGWEQGDATLLGEQMARLARLAHRVVWLNPHRGKDGYQPLQQGIRAVLPHVDDFVAGHSLRSFADVLEVIAGA